MTTGRFSINNPEMLFIWLIPSRLSLSLLSGARGGWEGRLETSQLFHKLILITQIQMKLLTENFFDIWQNKQTTVKEQRRFGMPAKKIKQKNNNNNNNKINCTEIYCTLTIILSDKLFWKLYHSQERVFLKKIKKNWLNWVRSKYILTNRIFNQLFCAWYVIKRNVVIIFP